jgi:hypothetical protein
MKEKMKIYAKMLQRLNEFTEEIRREATEEDYDKYELQFEEIEEIAYRLDTSIEWFKDFI